MKGFMKAAQKPKGNGHDAESADEDQPASTQQQVVHHQPPAPATATAPSHQDDDSDEEQSGPESRSQMLKRHNKEMTAHKKAVQRMGKKTKDELAKINKEIEDRHAAEAQALEAREKQQAASGDSDVNAATAELANAAVGTEHAKGVQKPSKAMKRREKHDKEEEERNARIAEEAAALGPSSRMVEEQQLAQLLTPLGLGMRDIKADGHCLYRAIEDQLSQQGAESASVPDYQKLRQQAAAYMTEHPDDFMPFIYNEDKEGDAATQLASYCEEMASTAAWGGQLELGALAEVLKRKIEVHAVGMPLVVLGEKYPGPALQVCYMRHAFGLGEHYNSVQPLSKPEDVADIAVAT